MKECEGCPHLKEEVKIVDGTMFSYERVEACELDLKPEDEDCVKKQDEELDYFIAEHDGLHLGC